VNVPVEEITGSENAHEAVEKAEPGMRPIGPVVNLERRRMGYEDV
jgi:hypothetical protein